MNEQEFEAYILAHPVPHVYRHWNCI